MCLLYASRSTGTSAASFSSRRYATSAVPSSHAASAVLRSFCFARHSAASTVSFMCLRATATSSFFLSLVAEGRGATGVSPAASAALAAFSSASCLRSSS
eukprot:Amastigsp_a511185_28.p3 type:complete len:100 gc:universal Amastigsp_a511185_28:605-306(-)